MPSVTAVHVETALSGLSVATKPGPDGRPKIVVKDVSKKAKTISLTRQKNGGITKQKS